MDDWDGLPLFAWRPPTAEIVPFPTRRRVGKARHVAEKLLASSEKVGAAYWRRTVGTMADQMERSGIAETTIRTEIAAFRERVEAEMNRLSLEERCFRPGDGSGGMIS